jgi:hypothetical protein
LGSVKDAAELTHLVRSLETDCDRLTAENERLSNSMGGVIAIVGAIAAKSSDLEEALPELKKELPADRIEMLDRVFDYHRQRLASKISVSVEPREESDGKHLP